MLTQTHATTTSNAPTSHPSSYAIGPIDPTQLLTLQAYLSDGSDITLLVPARISSALLDDPAWKSGYECGYLEGGIEEEWTVHRVVNHVSVTLRTELSREQSPCVYAWIVGYLLGDLAFLAETKRTLALVGVAHLDFLLSCFSLHTVRSLMDINALHIQAMQRYRARIRLYRAQGASFYDAQRLALVGTV